MRGFAYHIMPTEDLMEHNAVKKAADAKAKTIPARKMRFMPGNRDPRKE